MNIKNFEFKARVTELQSYENKLHSLNADFRGIDHQIDTYFNVSRGRLKLREGNIENALIHYDREDVAGAKQSNVILYRHEPDTALKSILEHQFGIKAIVDKFRKIYFIDNVKFHLDIVAGLGTFVEVEAIDTDGTHTIDELRAQCDYYFTFWGLSPECIVDKSYSDLILA